jgi:hypothetical protein
MPDGNPIIIGQSNTASNPATVTRLTRSFNPQPSTNPILHVQGTSGGDAIHGQALTHTGVHGTSDGFYGVHGNSNGGEAVRGDSVNSTGVRGHSGNRCGVTGTGATPFPAGFNTSGIGVFGTGTITGVRGHSNSNPGVLGTSGTLTLPAGIQTIGVGVFGKGTWSGVTGTSVELDGNGVIGEAHNGSQAYGVWGRSTSGYAGFFNGKVEVTGNLIKSGGGFKIDHPLEPATKYVNHSFVESSDMKNVYDGTERLDDKGSAWIELPEWFGELNRDYRYQLTAIGEPAPDLHIAEEISENRFRIAGGTAGMKVSWQVTGIRKDPWAEMNRIAVEEDKPEEARGTYLHPEVFGESETRGEDYAREEALRSRLAEMSDTRPPAGEQEPTDST